MTALQRGIVNENTVLNTVPYRINGHEIKDVARYSELTLTGVLQKSSNVGVSLTIPRCSAVMTTIGFTVEPGSNTSVIARLRMVSFAVPAKLFGL